MFYFKILVAFSFMFWLSAVIAEAVFKSSREQALPLIVKLGCGYLIHTVFFAAAWKFIPMGWAWLLGAALYLAYVFNQLTFSARRYPAITCAFVRKYIALFVWMFLGVNVFLVPLHLSGNYGPFTEGGGDVTVYADYAMFATKYDMPVYGTGDVAYDLERFAANPFGYSGHNLKSLKNIDRDKANPPYADYDLYIHSHFQKYPSIQFSPTGQWFFLNGLTNYHVFYAALAFNYALLILCSWCFLRPFGIMPASLLALLVLVSHGVVSVFYNVYFLQAMAITSTMLAASAVFHVRLFSREAIKVYGPILAFIIMGYLHFTAIVIPLMFISIKNWGDSDSRKHQNIHRRYSSGCLFRNASSAMFLAIVGSATIVGALGTLSPYIDIINSTFSKSKGTAVGTASVEEKKKYFGAAESLGSTKWKSFFFGSHSQQHYPPFVRNMPISSKCATWAVNAGTLIIFCGLAAWLLALIALRRNLPDSPSTTGLYKLLTVYIVCLLVIFGNTTIIQAFLYTQAKGAQNTLPLLYSTLVIPFSALACSRIRLRRLWLFVYASALLLFAVFLAGPRAIFTSELAFGLGRGSILESDYFQQAKHIIVNDKDPIVLFEPKKSSDLYLSRQPFIGYRMVPTRHLVIGRRSFDVDKRGPLAEFEPAIAFDFISEDDIQHMWTLSTERKDRLDSFAGPYFTYEWNAEKLINRHLPAALFAASDYEVFHSKKPLSKDRPDEGWYSYVRNGEVILFVPAGSGHVVRATILPVDYSTHDDVRAALNDYLAGSRGIAVETLVADAPYIVTEYDIPPDNEPRLIRIARHKGEYWINIFLDGKDIRDAS